MNPIPSSPVNPIPLPNPNLRKSISRSEKSALLPFLKEDIRNYLRFLDVEVGLAALGLPLKESEAYDLLLALHGELREVILRYRTSVNPSDDD